jgi:hypothetical protein
MKYRSYILLAASALLFSMASFALELELIPASFPAVQKPAFVKERATLMAEKKALDSKVARYNKRCAKPEPHEAHKCSVDRLDLFKLGDSYKLKVQDFNKRLAAIDKAANKKSDPGSDKAVDDSPSR